MKKLLGLLSPKRWYWLGLTLVTVLIAVLRRSQLVAANPTPFDIGLLIILIVLLLAPLATEIDIFGFRFRSALNEVKREVNQQMESLRLQVSSQQTQHSTLSLAGVGELVRVLQTPLDQVPESPPQDEPDLLDLVWQTRGMLERAVWDTWTERKLTPMAPDSTEQAIRDLSGADVISENAAAAGLGFLAASELIARGIILHSTRDVRKKIIGMKDVALEALTTACRKHDVPSHSVTPRST